MSTGSGTGAAWTASEQAERLRAAAGASASLDRLVGLAAQLLRGTSAQVSMLTDVQIVAAAAGPGADRVGTVSALTDSLCRVTVAVDAPLVVTDAARDERVRSLPPVASGAVASYLGVPLRTSDGQGVGALCVFDPAPRTWSDGDVTLLQHLARAVMAELELAALSAEYDSSRLRWDAALDAAGIGTFDWDLTADRVDWDQRLQSLFGYQPGEYVPLMSEAFSRIHPLDRAAVDHAIQGAIASGAGYRAEFRVQRPDGGEPWMSARGSVLRDDDGRPVRLIGTCHDVSQLRSARDQQALLLETMSTGFASVDTDWVFTYVNAAGSRIIGRTGPEVVGRRLWEVFPGLEESEFGTRYKHARESGQPVELEAYYEHLRGWFQVRAVPNPDGLHLYFMDVTDRRQAQQQALTEQARAQEAVARLELLALVSAELVAPSITPEQAVHRLAELVVPALGDWCVVTLFGHDGAVGHVGTWHADEALRPVVATYAAHRLEGIGPYAPLQSARASGVPVQLDAAAAARTIEMLRSPLARAAVQQLAPESIVVFPLPVRDDVAGTVSICRGAGRPPMTADEVGLGQEVAARAGLALDNARLHAEQLGLAEALQRSLLTLPPQPDHGQIVVRYAPAAESASVGGDWFDSFVQQDGATTLVIGDVVGHDSQAAAAMGQVRGLLRGIAWDSGAPPAEVLSRLDAALEGLQVHTTASAVVARLEQTPDERERGVTRMRWSNAGHPPPMVIHPDGTVAVVAGVAADLLLGIDPSTHRVESEIVLDRGATVLLYTDGLVERRGEDLDAGLARLRDTLSDLAARDLVLDELCDRLLGALAHSAEDDVALLAVRLHRQDRPRPPEAGPSDVPPHLPPEPDRPAGTPARGTGS
ncbi:MAG TPA: SpoIIE family protein phosphatase [Actinomycetales bacterium]|jgi:PAS domain S-box-containing protein